MKNLFCYLMLAISIMFAACDNRPQKLGDFKLLPLPQEFKITGASNLSYEEINAIYLEGEIELPILNEIIAAVQVSQSKNEAQIVARIDTTLSIATSGYFMNIDNAVVEISAKDQAGLFYAFQTLSQLIIDAQDQGVTLPNCTIKDFPKLAYRSIHLDIKHHRETTEYYYKLLDKLAHYKINGIIVELEDKLKYERQPLIGSEDALSIVEWRELSEYANDRFIEISPLVQGLGHSSFVLKHDEYKHLRDNPESDWAYNPIDPETYEVQFDMYLDAMEATPYGKYLHVGGDEVHTTGRNSGKSSLELQLGWLNKVSKFAEEHNRIPIFWDDMPLKDAGVYAAMFNTKLTKQEVDEIWNENEHKLLEFLDVFPKNCIYMRWNYQASEAIGNGKAMEWFRSHDLPVMGATAGQTRWVLMPQAESNMENIKNFAVSSINNNLSGLLLTLWDDDSPHFELYMRGILAFSEYTWTGEQRSKTEIKTAFRHREYSYSLAPQEFAFIDSLEKPVGFWKNALLNGNKRNYLAASENAIEELLIDLPGTDAKGEWSERHFERLASAEKHLKTCDDVAATIAQMKTITKRNRYNLEVYEQVNELTRFTLNMLLTLKSFDQAKNKEQIDETLSALASMSSQFEELRSELEAVYSQTRLLNKPENYILDQDHHHHLANQSNSFDWQFYAETLMFQKMSQELQHLTE